MFTPTVPSVNCILLCKAYRILFILHIVQWILGSLCVSVGLSLRLFPIELQAIPCHFCFKLILGCDSAAVAQSASPQIFTAD
jgi:hypothetical protein